MSTSTFTTNVVVYQVGYKKLYKAAYRMVNFCCRGWKPIGNSCTTPICFQECQNGTCVMPNVCRCLPGYYGAACDKLCELNKWGPGCTNTCQCKNNATCDMRNGFCYCLIGWQGTSCDQPCQQGYYGNNCSQACKCRNNAQCDHVTGDCFCERGYQGIFCEKPCNLGFYGNNCREKCRCGHGYCDHVSGTCTCKDGYIGSRCTETCPSGIYGKNCSLSCSCPQTALCDPINGSCSCRTGYTGESCDQKCPSGYEHVDGNCTCRLDGCSEHSKRSKVKSSSTNKDSLLPPIISVVIILIIISIAIACVAFKKRRNRCMGKNRKKDEPVYEVSHKNDGDAANKELDGNYQFVTKDSIPTYMELTGAREGVRQDNGIQNLTYQKLLKKSRAIQFNDVSSVAMDAQYAGLTPPKDSERVYQPLNRNDDLLQSLNKVNGESYHIRGNPGFEAISPAHYENLSSGSRTEHGNTSETLHLDVREPRRFTISDQHTYEILPPTRNDKPIYDNL